jgi:hypothetical protein
VFVGGLFEVRLTNCESERRTPTQNPTPFYDEQQKHPLYENGVELFFINNSTPPL